MRIALVEPSGEIRLAAYTTGAFTAEAFGLGYLASAARHAGHDTVVVQQGNRDRQALVDSILECRPDVVGLSVLTYTSGYSLQLASDIKRRKPQACVVLGGYHPTSMPVMAEDDAVDFLVLGEGERTFVELLDAIEAGRGFEGIHGIAYFDGRLRTNQPRPRIADLDGLPWPYRDGRQTFVSKGVHYPPPSVQKKYYVQYSRGCPYACAYCSSPSLWRGEVKWRSADDTVREVKYLNDQLGANLIFFADLTFNLSAERVHRLCAEIHRQGVDTHWFCECRPDNLDRELLEAMKTAGCTRIQVGIESVHDSALRMVKRGMTYERVRSALELTASVGLLIRGYVIIGFPWETRDSFQQTSIALRELPIDDLRLGFLTPFPGTELYGQYKEGGRLLTNDFRRYTGDEPVVRVDGMPAEELIVERARIFREFYLSRAYERRMKAKVSAWPNLRRSYDEFFDYLGGSGVLRRE